MKTFLRCSAIALLLGLIGLCLFGIAATFGAMQEFERMVWRTACTLMGLACVFGLVRPLRCQWHRWQKRRRNSAGN